MFSFGEKISVQEVGLDDSHDLANNHNLMEERYLADVQDQQMAMLEDRQGLGFSRKRRAREYDSGR